MWAGAGFFVAGFWAIYIAIKSKDVPIDPLVRTLIQVTCPIAFAGSYFHFPIGIYWFFLANFATYAVIRLMVEALRTNCITQNNSKHPATECTSVFRLGRHCLLLSDAPLLPVCQIRHVRCHSRFVADLNRSIRLLIARANALYPIGHVVLAG